MIGRLKNTTIKIRVNGKESENSNTIKAVRQGCPLSPSLFRAYVEDLEEMFTKLQIVSGRNKGSVLAYADDILVIPKSEGEM